MARTYTEVTEEGAKFNSADNTYSSTESFMTGNTDFDAIYNPITAFNFVLEVEGVYFLPLKTVKGFTKENEYEYIREGGVNDYVHMKRKPISKPFTFQIEKYVGTERFLDPLALGTELLLPLVLYVYRHKARQGLSAEAPAYPARIYVFTGCTVITKEYGELNAEHSSILTETTTIAYRELIVIPNPFQGSSQLDEWKAEDSVRPDGSYKNKYAAFPATDNKDSSTYPYTVEDGHLKLKNPMIRPEPKAMPQTVVYHRDPWDGSMGSKVKWAKENITELQEPVTFPENTRAKENKATTPKPVTYPKDSRRRENKTDLPKPVTYPPTKRALVAEALKKK